MSHLAQTDNAEQPVKLLGDSLPQQQLQRCSITGAAAFPAAAPKQEGSKSTATTAACPICGLELPLLALQQHVEQELSAVTDNDSITSMPATCPEQEWQRQSHAVTAGILDRLPDVGHNKVHRAKCKAQPPLAASQKAQKVS